MTVMQKLFGWNGRIRRLDYWLLNIASSIAFAVIDLILKALFNDFSETTFSVADGLSLLTIIPSLWISIALTLKRCHDRNKGGGWAAFFLIVPIVGWIWGFIELGFLDGTQGPNHYGRSPKGIGGDSDDKLAEVFA